MVLMVMGMVREREPSSGGRFLSSPNNGCLFSAFSQNAASWVLARTGRKNCLWTTVRPTRVA